MMQMSRHVTITAIMAFLLSGCSSPSLIVAVLPESDGHVGGISIEANGQKDTIGHRAVLLGHAYSAAKVAAGSNTIVTTTLNQDQISTEFSQVLANIPQQPRTYRLYFENDSLELTPDSKTSFKNVLADIATRDNAQVLITGHTDSSGSREFNDELSLQRAREASELFVNRGVPRSMISVAGRGSRELAVPTPVGVPEPLNRRVEVTVW